MPWKEKTRGFLCWRVNSHYLDGELRSDDEPRDADVTRVVEFACFNPKQGGKKVDIHDKTDGEFSRGKDTHDKMSNRKTRNIF